MLIHDLTPLECRAVLARTNIGRLGCSRDDQPYIVPILFSYDAADHCVYSFSLLGRKIEWMRSNPKVCLEVDDIGDQFHWTTVVALGRYQEITDDGPAKRRARELFEQRREWWLPAAAHRAGGQEHAVTVMYRLHLDSLTGRRTARPPR